LIPQGGTGLYKLGARMHNQIGASQEQHNAVKQQVASLSNTQIKV
jgi:hypothetical protein